MSKYYRVLGLTNWPAEAVGLELRSAGQWLTSYVVILDGDVLSERVVDIPSADETWIAANCAGWNP